jgi:pilus assembly protein CpaB
VAKVSLTKRSAALVVAIVLAALATIALVSYVRGVEDRAYAGVETVKVFVAKDTIPTGMSADEAIQNALIGTTTIPRKVRSDGAIVSLDEIKGKVAQVTVFKGEQIVGPRWGAPGQAGSTLAIPADKQAMSVEVGIPPGVAGFIQEGSYVSIIAKLAQAQGAGQPQAGDRVQFLLQDVQVLKTGVRTVVTPGEKEQPQQVTSNVLLTLALTPSQAEKLAYAVFEGDIYFTLVPNGQRPATTPGRTQANAFR